jgi:hypothetical protein
MLRPIAPVVRHTLALVALAALAACGGGGGSDSPSTSGNTAAQVTVQGVAAKGLLQKAKVEVLQVNANGSTTLLKEGTTDDKGGYSLTGIPAGTAVVVRVSAVAGTKMVDEATGDTLDAPVGFVMRAATVTQEGGTNALQITPFSEMAVAKAEAGSGGLSANNIEAANADVRTYLGFDVLAEKPEFTGLKGADPQNKAALAVAAISQLASSSGLGCTDTKQEDRVKCVVGKMAQKGTDDAELGASIETSKQTIKGEKKYTGEVPPAPLPQPDKLVPSAERASATAEAKALIANIRSNGPFLGGSGADTLEKRLSSTADILQNASSPVGDGSQELFKRVLGAAAALDSKEFTPGVFEVATETANAARCTFFSNATSPTDNTEATSVDNAKAIGCRLSYDIVREGANFYAYQQGLRIMPTPIKGTYTVITQVVKQPLDLVNGQFTNGNNPATLLPAGSSVLLGQVSLKRDANANLNGFTLSGDYATSVYNVINGLAAKNTITASVVPVAEGSLTRLNVSGVFTSSGGSLPGATVQLAPGSYFQTSFAQPGNVIDSPETDQLSRAARLILAGGVGQASVTGTLDINSFKAPKSALGAGAVKALPTSLSFNGVIKQSASVTLFDGTLAVSADSLSEFDPNVSSPVLPTNLKATFAGKLYVPSRPLMQVNLTLTKPSSGVTEVSGQYVQEATTVIIAAKRSTKVDADNYLNLLSGTGVNLRIKPNVPRTLVTKSDVTIGVYDADKSRIDYANGSFEQY